MIHHFERRVPDLNLARFYRLEVEPSLFGDWSLRRIWGRIGTRGRERLESYPTHTAACEAAGRAARRRRHRGYQPLPEESGPACMPAQLELPLGAVK